MRTQVKDVRRCPMDQSVHWSQARVVGGQSEFRLTSYATNYYMVGAAVNLGREHPYERLDREGTFHTQWSPRQPAPTAHEPSVSRPASREAGESTQIEADAEDSPR